MRQELSGILTAHDTKTHVAHEVALPRVASRLHVRLEHPRGPGCGHMLCLSLFDSNGFRGSGHRDGEMRGQKTVHEVDISAGSATPGYLPGPVPAGPLRIVIHAHRIVKGAPFRYRLAVEWEGLPSKDPVSAPRVRRARSSPPAGPGWRRGDLHAHTVHSDGTWDVPSLLSGCRDAGLDFVAITDHNTISQLADIEDPFDPLPLVVSGMEITTFRGHALGLGMREWIDWGALQRERSMADVVEEVGRRGALFVIAHPMAEGDPLCTGCDWRYDELMPGPAPAVEVWNGPWDDGNERALDLWRRWLDRGLRIVATAGSDAHDHGGYSGRIGWNVVWSRDGTERAILDAVAAGHLYLSAGPILELRASAAGMTVMMGDTLSAGSAEMLVRWDACPPRAILRLIADGAVISECDCEGSGERRREGVRARWCTAEARDAAGSLLAITNPVYLEPEGRAS